MKPVTFVTLMLFCFTSHLSHAEQEGAPQWRTESVETSKENATKVEKSSVAKSSNNAVSEKQAQVAQSKSAAQVAVRFSDHTIWVYDAWVSLHTDRDHDNYYTGIELSFDVDTNLSHADVYARIFLGDGTLFREIYTTSDFHIDANSSSDEITLSTRLVEGFVPKEYDLLIEIYDVDYNELQDSYDHTSDNDLFLLPLESSEYEHSHGTGGQVVITTEHGGSAPLWAIVILASVVALRRWWKV
ncbi:choice-of-anchor H family protein [Planctobacterium marinum]|uniref:GlyGly-CTERM sorting domain-containing protein n=1 Tax=Planctobacterium marinum TaxID=1631968 RepID=A0AA48HS94_9ALTE|nr:hypothetical protein MACH26_04240 [Planctobacterium marinum]